MHGMKSVSSAAIFMRVTLQEIEPPIWRRLIVPHTFHLDKLQQAIRPCPSSWRHHREMLLRGEVVRRDCPRKQQAPAMRAG